MVAAVPWHAEPLDAFALARHPSLPAGLVDVLLAPDAVAPADRMRLDLLLAGNPSLPDAARARFASDPRSPVVRAALAATDDPDLLAAAASHGSIGIVKAAVVHPRTPVAALTAAVTARPKLYAADALTNPTLPGELASGLLGRYRKQFEQALVRPDGRLDTARLVKAASQPDVCRWMVSRETTRMQAPALTNRALLAAEPDLVERLAVHGTRAVQRSVACDPGLARYISPATRAQLPRVVREAAAQARSLFGPRLERGVRRAGQPDRLRGWELAAEPLDQALAATVTTEHAAAELAAAFRRAERPGPHTLASLLHAARQDDQLGPVLPVELWDDVLDLDPTLAYWPSAPVGRLVARVGDDPAAWRLALALLPGWDLSADALADTVAALH